MSLRVTYDEIAQRGRGRMTSGDLGAIETAVRLIGAKRLMEIGAMDGTSSILLGLLAEEVDGHLFSIDPKPTALWQANIRALALESYITFIMGRSETVQPNVIGQVDFLLIDGDHRSRWCIHDYHKWNPSVRIGGAIAFHDWTGAKGVALHIRRAVSIIREDAHLTEIAKWEGRDRGIIIFRKDAEDDPWGDHKPIQGWNWP